MKSKRSSKRLQISTETLRTLTTDDVRNIVGGVGQGGAPGGQAAGFTDSFSISVGGNHCCCNQ
jgi:hypothetical protein